MNAKERFYSGLAKETIGKITSNTDNWTSFLRTMSRNYEFTYPEQVMIYAQRPNATFCKPYEDWNAENYRRYVKRGSTGIALFVMNRDKPYLRYVFDVADTGVRRSSPELKPWEVTPENRSYVMEAMERTFGVAADGVLEAQLEDIASALAAEYWDDYKKQFLDIVANSFLEEYDELNIEVAFKNAVANSVSYTMYCRFVESPDNYFEHEDFQKVFDFNTRQTVNALGTAVNAISTRMFQEIEKAIGEHEQIKATERSTDYERDDLQTGRRLSDSEPSVGERGRETSGQVRQDASSIFGTEQSDAPERHDSDGEPVPAPVGDRGNSESQSGVSDGAVPEGQPRTGQGNAADGVGAAHEQPESTGGGSRDDGAYQQLSLNLFLSENEQISFIDRAESFTPSAFSFAQEEIDHFLLLGSNTDEARKVVALEYMKQKPLEEIVQTLKQVYHGGYGLKEDSGNICAWYAEDGIHLAKGSSAIDSPRAQIVSWETVAERIGELLENGRFATNVELVEASGYERQKLAESLWHLYHDLSEEARSSNYLAILHQEPFRGFPDETADLAEKLDDPRFHATLVQQYSEFRKTLAENPDLLRFHYHKLNLIQKQLYELNMPLREYQTDMMQMQMKLVLAEKPSVAQSIAKVLGAAKREDGYLEGNGYVVSWCVGHLVELAQPEVYDAKYSKWAYADLPIFPMDWQYEVSAGTKKQFGILKKLMAREDVASLVCATDAGREGELIFRLVYHKAGCRKPFERLWISSMEDVAIKEGFENLRSGTEYDALYEAALCRERADWIVGINATRLFSTLYGQTLNVGRVMTPTLAMAVMREAAISAFKPELFYTVQIGLDGFTAASERFKTKAAAEAVKQSCSVAIVQKAECKEKTEKPPALYDLTSLQREANRVLGYTAQQTLDYTQNLYEKKLVTYPRTDSRFLTEDMAHSLTDLVKLAFHTFPVEDVDNIPVHAEQVVNNKKVTDHHAIIPTRELQKCNLSELPKGELAILQLISNRLCVAVGDPHRYAETVIELDCGGTVFSTKGKTVVQDGWKALVQKNDSTKSDENVQTLPSVSVGDEMTVSGTEIKEGKTSPPKHFTEDTLLSAMETAGADEMPDEVERKGLGTPATRAGIIEKLVRIGFLERKGDKKTKHLIPTHKGTALVTVMPEQIQSPSMTADWEEKLLLIEKGEYASEDFMDEIKDVIAGLIQNYEVIRDSEVMMSKEANSIGKCPLCGSAVEDKAKAFFCSNRACKFALWKNNRYFASIGKSMTSATAQKLLGSGKVKLKNCKSERTGNTFDATVFMEVSDDGKTKFSMEFENGGKRK